MKIDVDTPTSKAVKIRSSIVGLAQLVFDHPGRDSIRAFSQFTKSPQLAEIIDAKRDGVFDYGVCIQEVEEGYQWPPADAVLKALAKAEEGELTEDDMESLGLEPEDLGRLLMDEEASKGKRKTTKKAAPKKAPEPEPDEDEEDSEEEEEEEKPKSKKTIRKTRTRSTAPKKTEEDAPASDGGDVIERIDQLARDLAGAFGTLDKEISGAVAKNTKGVEQLLLGFRGLVGLVESVYVRQDTLAAHVKCYADQVMMGLTGEEAQAAYDEEGDPIPLPEVNSDAINDIRIAMGLDEIAESDSADDDSDDDDDDDAEEEVEEDDSDDDSVDEESVDDEDDSEEEEEEEADDGELVHYSKEALEELDDDALRELAGKLGIPNAGKIAYRGVIIRKITKAQA